MSSVEVLLGYEIIKGGIMLIDVGVHENFYLDIKKKL